MKTNIREQVKAMTEIQSAQNPTVRRLKGLKDKKGREESGGKAHHFSHNVCKVRAFPLEIID